MVEADSVSREHLLEIIGQVPLGICVLASPSLRIIAANSEYAALVGVPDATSLIGTSPTAESVDSLTRLLLPIWRQVAATGNAFPKTEIETAEGEGGRFFEVMCTPRKHPDGSVCAIVTMIADVTHHVRVEQELRESERLFRALTENSGVGIWQIDAHTQVTIYANPAMRFLLQAERLEDLAGRNYQSFLTPESWQTVQREITKRVHGIASSYEAEIVGLRGRKHTVVVSGAPLFSPEGNLESLIGTFTDITPRKQAEDALRESEERFRTLSASAPVGIFQMDAAGRCTYVNARWEIITGMSFERAMGYGWSETLHPEERPVILAEWEKTAREGGEWTKDARLVTPRGLRWVHAHALPFCTPDGQPTGYVGTIEDITERKQAEEERVRLLAREREARAAAEAAEQQLRESYALLDTLQVAAPVGMAFLDHDLRYVRINEALAVMNGLSPQEHLGRTVSELLPALASQVVPLIRSVLETGEPVINREVSGQTPQAPGEICYWLSNYYPVRTPDGRMIGIGMVVLDITERKRAEQALEAARRHVLQAEMERKRFYCEVIRAVTHDHLHLVDPGDIPIEGRLVLDLPLVNAENYSRLRKQLKEISEQAGMASEAADDLVLAAGEAATNAIKHAVEGRCEVYVTADRVLVRVSDRGKGIRPEALPGALLLPGFSTTISLGMGYTLMLKLVDRVWLATGAAGTVVQLEKAIHPVEIIEPEPAAWNRL